MNIGQFISHKCVLDGSVFSTPSSEFNNFLLVYSRDIITPVCIFLLTQIIVWWYSTKAALVAWGGGGGGGKHGGSGGNSSAQHACSSLCDEVSLLNISSYSLCKQDSDISI